MARSDDGGWEHVHPATVLFELAKAAQQIVIGFVVVSGGGWLSSLEALVVLVPLGGAVARWYTTRYRVDDEAVRFEYGLLWRKRQVIARPKIQNVTSTANVVARALDLVEIQISEASGDGDIGIRYVKRPQGERLAVVLRTGTGAPLPRLDAPPPTAMSPAAGTSPTGPPPTGTPPTGTPTVGPPTGPPVLGLDAPSAWPPPAPVAAPAPVRPPVVAPPFGEVLRVQLARRALGALSTLAVVAGAVIVAGALGVDVFDLRNVVGSSLVVLVSLGTAVVASVTGVFALGGFQLWDEPDRLRIQTGLLKETGQAVRRERIQAIAVDHHVLLRAQQREQVRFETADIEIGDVATSTTLSPASPWGTWRRLALLIWDEVDLDEDRLRPVARATIRRAGVRWSMLVLLVAGPLAANAWWLGWRAPAAVVVGLAVVALGGAWAVAVRRWQRLGHALDDRHLLVRSGVVAERLQLVDLDKIQLVRTTATIFQRRLDLVSLHLTTAGRGGAGSVVVPDLPTAEARELADRLVARSIATPLDRTI